MADDAGRHACGAPAPARRRRAAASRSRSRTRRSRRRGAPGRAPRRRARRRSASRRRAPAVRPLPGRSRRRRRRPGSPTLPIPSPDGLQSSGPGTDGAGSAWRMKSGSSAREEHERARAEPARLLDRHRAARERAAVLHAVHRDRERRIGRGGAREDRVHGLHRLAGLPRERGDDRLAEELAAEDDAVAAREVLRAVGVATIGLEREGAQQRVDRGTRLLRREAQRAVEADVLAVQVGVAGDRLDEERELLGAAHPLREDDVLDEVAPASPWARSA